MNLPFDDGPSGQLQTRYSQGPKTCNSNRNDYIYMDTEFPTGLSHKRNPVFSICSHNAL